MKMIGQCNGMAVMYDGRNGVVAVYGTHIRIVGCKDEQEAKEVAKRNLINFEEVKES